MDLRSLRYFTTVVDAASLTRAAGMLYVAQPALTAQIKRLESEFGVRLLERARTGVTPTAAGLQLYQEAVRLLAAADALRSRVGKRPGEPDGPVTVAFPVLLVGTLLGEILQRTRERFPRVRIHVIDEESVGVQRAVQDGRAEFGLLVDPQNVAGLRRHPVATESLYLTGADRDGRVRQLLRDADGSASPARGRQRGPREATIRFADAATLPLVLQSRRYVIRRQVEEAAAAAGVRLDVVHEHDSAAVLRSLTRIGAGFSFTPACVVPRRGGDPDFVGVRVVEPGFRRTYALSWLSGRQFSAAARAVVEITRAEIATAIEGGRWPAEHLDALDHQLK